MTFARPFDLQGGQPLAAARPHSTAQKLLGLELLRFVAALVVLLNHYRFFAQMGGRPAIDLSDMPFRSLFGLFFDHGFFAVQAFWGISGYIFFWKYGAAIHSRAIAARDFFWLRFSRLYPLHLVTLLAVVGLQLIHRQIVGYDFIYQATDGWEFGKQIFLASDWGPPVEHSFNGPIWSISAEIAVYAAFFLLVRKIEPSARLCLAVVVAGLVLQLAGFNWASIGCATYFFAGGLAALMPREATRPAALILAALAAICLATELLNQPSVLPLMLLVAVPCLLILLSLDWPVLAAWERPIQAAANLTYSSYLLHFPVQLSFAIGIAIGGARAPIANPLFLVAYIGVTMAIAAVSYRWLELPTQQWLRGLTRKEPEIT